MKFIIKIKKSVIFILLLIMIISMFTTLSLTAGAKDTYVNFASYGSSEDLNYDILSDGTAEIISCNIKGEEIKIPDTLDGYTVTSISWNSFYSCRNIKSVVIPNSVKNIGNCAFAECVNLEEITIPDSVTNIGYSAFNGTAWYDKQPDGLVYAGKVAYNYKGDCPQTLKLKQDTLAIADEAFYGQKNLKSIIIPDGVVSIGSYAFYDCANLTNITIPDSVISIDEKAFYNTDWYDSRPEGLIYAGKVAYEYKGDKEACPETIELNKDTVAVACSAFYNCINLKNITIPNGVVNIDSSAFAGSGLTSLMIPDSVVSIGEHAFKSCVNLKSVTIPGSIKVIQRYTFEECEKLENLILPDSITNIGLSAFRACKSLKSLIIPDSVINIWDYAFGSCTGLTSLTLGNSVRIIGESAFRNSKSLTSVTIPYSVTSIKKCGIGFISESNKIENFTINGYSGTEAERYAHDNGFIFVKLSYGSDTDNQTRKNITDVIPADVQTNTYYFYKPKDWDKVGVYWFSGSYNCEKDENKSNGKGYPGYAVTQTDESDKNIYIVKIPKDVPSISFNNLLDGEKGIYTTNLSCAENASKIFIVNPNTKIEDETNTVRGEWFYYYKNGKHGRYKTLDEAQKNNAVYSNGEVPKKISDKNTTPTVSKQKQANPIKVTAKTKTVKAKKLKRSKVTVNALTVKKAKGEVKYKKLSGSKKLTVNKKGKITIKKGTKKGTYKIKIKITAKGTKKYKSKTVTKKITIKIK